MRAHKEAVLLLEDDGGLRFRVVVLRQPVTQILERVHISQTAEITRVWVCRDDERDLTRQCRIFREVLTKPFIKQPDESPVFDELVIHKPLPLTFNES